MSSLMERVMSLEEILAQLSDHQDLPILAIEAATTRRDEIAPLLIKRIESYLATPEAEREDPGIFFAVHLLAEWREAVAFPIVTQLFRLPEDELDHLLGDSITEHAARILVAIFDGDPQPIFDLILDRAACEWTRNLALEALAVLAVRGAIPREVASEFVGNTASILGGEEDMIVWDGWQQAVALLGLTALAPKARRVIRNLLAPARIVDVEDFDADLDRAIASPDNPWEHPFDGAPYGRVVDEVRGFAWSSRESEALAATAAERLAKDRFSAGKPAGETLQEHWTERSLPLRQRKEVQEVLSARAHCWT